MSAHPVLSKLEDIHNDRVDNIKDGHTNAVAIADARAHEQFKLLLAEAPGYAESNGMNKVINSWKTNGRDSRTVQLNNIVKTSVENDRQISKFWAALLTLTDTVLTGLTILAMAKATYEIANTLSGVYSMYQDYRAPPPASSGWFGGFFGGSSTSSQDSSGWFSGATSSSAGWPAPNNGGGLFGGPLFKF